MEESKITDTQLPSLLERNEGEAIAEKPPTKEDYEKPNLKVNCVADQ